VTVKQDKKRRTWFYVVDVPAPGGRRRQVKRRGFGTKKEATVAEAEVLADVRRGRYVRPSRSTVGQYLVETWLPARRADLRPSTIHGYEKVVTGRIVPMLGDVPLSALDVATVEAFYGRLLTSGGKNGRALSAKTVANAAGVLSAALADAVRLRLLPHNVTSDARLPRRSQREMSAWTAAEAERFLASVRESRLWPLWRLALASGLRRGELAGLRWRDVDVAAGSLQVAHTRVTAGKVVEGEPKTKAGFRVVALDDETVGTLKAWRRTQTEERLLLGAGWRDTGYVFTNELGEPPYPGQFTKWWNTAVKAAGVPRIRLHDARHTSATLLLRAGVPVKVVSQRIGHADVAVTMRIYQHVTAQDDRAAADALGQVLGGGR